MAPLMCWGVITPRIPWKKSWPLAQWHARCSDDATSYAEPRERGAGHAEQGS